MSEKVELTSQKSSASITDNKEQRPRAAVPNDQRHSTLLAVTSGLVTAALRALFSVLAFDFLFPYEIA